MRHVLEACWAAAIFACSCAYADGPTVFSIKSNTGDAVFTIDALGNCVTTADIVQNAVDLDSLLAEGRKWAVKRGDTVLAVLDKDSATPALYLAGCLVTHPATDPPTDVTLTPPDRSFIVRTQSGVVAGYINSIEDADGNPAGSLVLEGAVTQGAQTYFVLTLTQDGNGAVTADPAPGPGGVYETGTAVSVQATPDTAWQFDHWENDASGTQASVDLTMDADKSVEAVFVRQPRTIEIDEQGGAVTVWRNNETTPLPHATTYTAVDGDALKFTFDPHCTVAWSGANAADVQDSQITVSGNMQIAATFSCSYALSVAVDGVTTDLFQANGGGAEAGTYPAGTLVSVSAPDISGYKFIGWSGDATSATSALSVTMSQDISVTATYSQYVVLREAVQVAVCQSLNVVSQPVSQYDLSRVESLDVLGLTDDDVTSLYGCTNIKEIQSFLSVVDNLSQFLQFKDTLESLVLGASFGFISDFYNIPQFTHLTKFILFNFYYPDSLPTPLLTYFANLPIKDLWLCYDTDGSEQPQQEHLQIPSLPTPCALADNLNTLYLWWDDLTDADVANLSVFTHLQNLHLDHNAIANAFPASPDQQQPLSFLAALPRPQNPPPFSNQITISLSYNQLVDIFPLVANPVLGTGDTIDVSYNRDANDQNTLTQYAVCREIPALTARGATVTTTAICNESSTPGEAGYEERQIFDYLTLFYTDPNEIYQLYLDYMDPYGSHALPALNPFYISDNPREINIPTQAVTISIQGQGTVYPGPGQHEFSTRILGCGDFTADTTCGYNTVTFTAIPAPGWVFNGWVGELPSDFASLIDPQSSTYDPALANNPLHDFRETRTLTMDKNHSLVATFAYQPGVQDMDLPADLAYFLDAIGEDGSDIYNSTFDRGQAVLNQDFDFDYSGDGIPDVAQFLLLQTVLKDKKFDLAQLGGVANVFAWEDYSANLTQAKTDMPGDTDPRIIRAIAAYMSLGTFEFQHWVASAVAANFLDEANDPVILDPESYQNNVQRFFSAKGDANNDGASNSDEWVNVDQSTLTGLDKLTAFVESALGIPSSSGATSSTSRAGLSVMASQETQECLTCWNDAQIDPLDVVNSLYGGDIPATGFLLSCPSHQLDSLNNYVPAGRKVFVTAQIAEGQLFYQWNLPGTQAAGSDSPTEIFTNVGNPTYLNAQSRRFLSLDIEFESDNVPRVIPVGARAALTTITGPTPFGNEGLSSLTIVAPDDALLFVSNSGGQGYGSDVYDSSYFYTAAPQTLVRIEGAETLCLTSNIPGGDASYTCTVNGGGFPLVTALDESAYEDMATPFVGAAEGWHPILHEAGWFTIAEIFHGYQPDPKNPGEISGHSAQINLTPQYTLDLDVERIYQGESADPQCVGYCTASPAGQNYSYGDVVTLTAHPNRKPDSYYAFLFWCGNGNAWKATESTDNPPTHSLQIGHISREYELWRQPRIKVQMDKSRYLRAVFCECLHGGFPDHGFLDGDVPEANPDDVYTDATYYGCNYYIIHIINEVARQWKQYQLDHPPASFAATHGGQEFTPRPLRITSISHYHGGPRGDDPCDQHQNGLNVDVEGYVTSDYDRFVFRNPNGPAGPHCNDAYSEQLTLILYNMFASAGSIEKDFTGDPACTTNGAQKWGVCVSPYGTTGIDGHPCAGHENHIHLTFADPDGVTN